MLSKFLDPKNKTKISAICLGAILLITFLSYLPALKNGFTNWDDNYFVVENPTIKNLSLANLKNILTQVVVKNWHPLTMLSFSLEYHFFQLNPAAYHTTNLILHLLNTLLVFGFIYFLTENQIMALLTSLLFGVHPMHVESVAWVAERKDVLFSFFFLISLIAYVLHIKGKKRKGFFCLALFAFLCSLLSKVTAVSLPLVLLLIDYFLGRKIEWKLFFEKIPFFILSLIAGIVILGTHTDVIFLRGKYLYDYSGIERIFLSGYGLLSYIIKIAVPYPLSAVYPYPQKIDGSFSPIFYLSIFIVLGLLAVIFVRKWKDKKLINFCVLFFLVTIFANLPFSVIGETVIADRYIYIPCIGLLLLAAHAVSQILSCGRPKILKPFTIMFLTGYFAFFAFSTFAQTKIWKNSISLWSDVIAKDPNIGFAYYNRSSAYSAQKRYDLAVEDLTKAIELGPVYLSLDAYTNRGQIYGMIKENDLAIADLTKVLEINPKSTPAYNNRGLAYMQQKKYDLAIADFDRSISLNPGNFDAYNNRGVTYLFMHNLDESLTNFQQSLKINPQYAPAYFNISKIYLLKGDASSAMKYADKARSLGYPVDDHYLLMIKQALGSI